MKIPLDAIIIPPRFDRRSIDQAALDQLADDIRANGLIQPIAVRELDGGKYQLVAGKRRVLAHRQLALDSIEAHVTTSESNDVVLALAENVKRQNISPVEEADVVRHLHDTLGLSIAEICEQTRHGTSWVQDRLALAALDAPLVDAVHDRKLSIGAALQLAEIDDTEYRNYLVHVARTNGATIHQAQAWTLDYKARRMLSAPPPDGSPIPQPPPLPPRQAQPCACCDAPVESDAAIMIRVCSPCLDALRRAKAEEPEPPKRNGYPYAHPDEQPAPGESVAG